MERISSKVPHFARLLTIFASALVLLIDIASAQNMMGGQMSCPMCGAMGWGGMILGGLMMIAIITALFSLAVYLIRRSRSAH